MVISLDEGAAMSILDLPMKDNDARVETVGEYLSELLRILWIEEEGFNGKRPFGNSGWQSEVYDTLASSGVIKAENVSDDDEYEEWEYDTHEAEMIVLDAIKELFARG